MVGFYQAADTVFLRMDAKFATLAKLLFVVRCPSWIPAVSQRGKPSDHVTPGSKEHTNVVDGTRSSVDRKPLLGIQASSSIDKPRSKIQSAYSAFV